MDGDYSKHPKSIGELRSDKSENALDWTPRDALISVLRDIDSGKEKPVGLVIVWLDAPLKEKGVGTTAYTTAGLDTVQLVGLLAMTQTKIIRPV